MTTTFTIVSCNYLAEARALMASVKQFVPESRRTVFFIDDWAGKFDPEAEDFECLAAWNTGLPRYRHYAFAYSPGEFCFALKPFCAAHLFAHTPAESLIYVDSDMLFLSRPEALHDSLRKHPIVLAPHKLRAAARPEHFNIVRAGAFNAGFFAVSRSAQADEFLRWWGEQMIEPGNMTQDWFFDQGWLDLVPGYFDGTEILRHPGYNVAFWNLAERRVWRDAGAWGQESVDGGQGPEAEAQDIAQGLHATGLEEDAGGEWKVEFRGRDYPLVLFHFSMFDPRHPDRISGPIDYSGVGSSDDLIALLRMYAGRLARHGLGDCRHWSYDHGAFADGKTVTRLHREFFKKRVFHVLSEQADPFDPPLQARGLGSLYNVDHPVARFGRGMKGMLRCARRD